MRLSYLTLVLLGLMVGTAHAEPGRIAVDTALSAESLNGSEKKEVLREVLKSGRPLRLTNLKTNQVEVIEDPYMMTKQDALKYLPDVPEIVEIFNIYADDVPPYAALIKTYGDLQKML